MRKLNLKPYNIKIMDRETGEPQEILYPIIQNLEQLVTAPQQQNTPHDGLTLARIFVQIRNDTQKKPFGIVLLEESDYNLIKTKYMNFKGVTMNETELTKRIQDAEQVEVKEKKEKT